MHEEIPIELWVTQSQKQQVSLRHPHKCLQAGHAVCSAAHFFTVGDDSPVIESSSPFP